MAKNKTKKVLTNKEILNMAEGTPIKVKDTVDCHEKYKLGGKLVIDYDSVDGKGDYPFGIQVVGFGFCNMFKAAEYELINQ